MLYAPLVMETDDVQVVGVGYIDFRQSEVNLQFKPKALRQQFIKIAQPFAIKGSLNHPQLRLTGAPGAGAVVEVLAFPFNLLNTIVQPGPHDPGRAPCRVIQTSQTAGGLLTLTLPLAGKRPDPQWTAARAPVALADAA